MVQIVGWAWNILKKSSEFKRVLEKISKNEMLFKKEKKTKLAHECG